MTGHLRFAGKPELQDGALRDIIAHSPVLQRSLQVARNLALPDWWIVSGAIYNQVWNQLTGRPEIYGVKDIDLFYFDRDTSFAAEDRIIKRLAPLFAARPPVEARNQSRVHLWYPQHFGQPYPALACSAAAIDRFASRTHCVGIRLGEALEIYAPYGLDDIFSFRLTPNPVQDNRATHVAKAARQMALWPELTLVPWPG